MSEFWKSSTLRRRATVLSAVAVCAALTGSSAFAACPPEPTGPGTTPSTGTSTASAAPLSLSTSGTPQLEWGGSKAEYPGNPGPNTGKITTLGGTVPIGGQNVPISDIVNLGNQISVISSTSTASKATDTDAAAGALGDGGNPADPITINLLKLTSGAVQQGLVDDLTLNLGAFSSRTKFVNGKLQPTEYKVGQVKLRIGSKVVKDAASQLYNALGGVDRQIEKIVNQNANLAPVQTLLGSLGLPKPTLTVESNTRDKIFKALLAKPLTSKNKLVTIDLSTGSVVVDLEQLASGGLNNQPPNKELLSSKDYPLIAQTVHDVMQDATNIAVGAIEGAMDSIKITLRWAGPVLGGNLDVSWTFTPQQAITGTAPKPVDKSTGLAKPLGIALVNTLNSASPLLKGVVKPAYDLIIADAGNGIFDLLINKIKFGFTSTVVNMLQPVFDIATQVVSVQVNHQESKSCTLPDNTKQVNSQKTSALSIGLLKATNAARLDFGRSAGDVTIPNCK
ncbi:hypothetical protein GCM10027589_35110 [Actinocorallia lasiicapitis]